MKISKTILIPFVIGLIVIIATMFYFFYQEQNKIRNQHISDSKLMADVIEEHTDYVLRYVDNYLYDMLNEFVKKYNTNDVAKYIQENPFNKDVIYAVNVFDNNGRDIYTTSGDGPFTFDYSKTDYFIYHKTHNDNKSFIAPLKMGQITNRILFRISKRINNLDGTFWGVINVSVDPVALTKFYANIEHSKYDAISLRHLGSRTLLSRYPFPNNIIEINENHKNDDYWAFHATHDSGIYIDHSTVDNRIKTIVTKKIKGTDIFVIICIDEGGLIDHLSGTVNTLWVVGISLSMILLTGLILTERMRLERNTAKFANEAKTKFITNMTHELRTPLNAIIGFSEIIKNESLGKTEPEYVDFANDIFTSGNHLLSIVNDVLDVAKMDVGKMTLGIEACDLKHTIINTTKVYGANASQKGLTISVDVDDCPDVVYADNRALRQIIINLLTNAIKFTNIGSINISTKSYSKYYEIHIKDTGIGISPELHEKIFIPFVQQHNEYSKKNGGTGLGLPIVRGLVKLHKGTINFRSEIGKGTVFIVRMPIKP